jgi:outer membrane beta-barrel protein
MRTKTLLKTVAALTVSACALFGAGTEKTASAQEIQLTGPLAGAPSVRKMRLYRQGRIQIQPSASFELLGEYRRTMCFGATAQYNIFDFLGVGVFGCFGAVSITTDLSDQVDAVAPRNSRTAVNVNHTGSPVPTGRAPFEDQTAKIQFMLSVPQVQFAPFRGKLAIFQKIFVDTDLYLHAGLGLTGLQERGDCGATGQKPCTDPSTFQRTSRMAVGPTFGLGINLYTGDLVNINLEYRAFPFTWNRGGFDQRGAGNNGKFPDNVVNSDDRTFKFNQAITVGVGFTFPKAKVSD